MLKSSLKVAKSTKSKKSKLLWQRLLAFALCCTLVPVFAHKTADAEVTSYCHTSPVEAKEKESLRLQALKGNKQAQARYKQLAQKHGQKLQQCRNGHWLKTQAIWLRLYPCDLQPGAIDQIMDRLVNRGYSHVYVEYFYDGQVLLPSANNPTVWPSIIRARGAEKVDLLSQAIQRGQARGLKVYAWMYTMNFGYNYATIASKEPAIARNGKGQTSLYVVDGSSQVFVDPYSKIAQKDYYQMVLEGLRRRPDGMLFDYVRYPRQTGQDSIATKVTDLWLYSQATQQALFKRSQNYKGLDLMRRFLGKGFITAADVQDVDKIYPQEREPLWQGRNPAIDASAIVPPELKQPQLQMDLWQLAVAHAMQGILDFVNLAAYPAQQQGVSTGAVFFPGGNQKVGQGYDSRLQPWDRFPNTMEWHPMSYANCGRTNCIAQEVERVLSMAPPGTRVIPALAGTWGKSVSNRPSLEAQMQALKPFASRIQGVSHFAYSWQFPEHDGDRKFCRN